MSNSADKPPELEDSVRIRCVQNGYTVFRDGAAMVKPWVFESFEGLTAWLAANLRDPRKS